MCVGERERVCLSVSVSTCAYVYMQLKDIEDEEQALQRKITQLAMDAARSEAEKSMTKALTVEAAMRQVQDQMREMQSAFAKEVDSSRKREDALQTQLTVAVNENKRLSLAVDDIDRQNKDGEKHRKDLEEAIFYLQDEIIKNKPKPLPPPPEPVDPNAKKKK
mmetsp:Transcript_98456/g.158765  ORF Transcript_98456/g.158765 Transcript_98456/m.158765 type:complete len:163 (+) Transcript_98456:172-660(+)